MGFDMKGEVSIPASEHRALSFELRDALGHGFNSHQMLGFVDDPKRLPNLELLLSVNSDENAGLRMRAHLYVDRERLRARDFSTVIVTIGP